MKEFLLNASNMLTLSEISGYHGGECEDGRDIAARSLVEVDCSFRSAYCLHHQYNDCKMSVCYKTARHHIPEGCHLQQVSLNIIFKHPVAVT
jgi:hypothetical protein